MVENRIVWVLMALNFFRELQKRNRDFQLEVDGKNLSVAVVENDRAKRLTLRIVPSGDGLKVTTPSHVGDDEVHDFVNRNRHWVAVKLSKMPERVKLEAGSMIPLHGVDHELIATGKNRGVVESVVIDGRHLLYVPGDKVNISRKLVDWMKREARYELNKAVAGHAAKIGVRPRQIRITDTTSRWGSCSSNRVLSFSWRIIMAPPGVLDYLAAHETAHLVEMNHSERFWDLTKRLCPETDRHKQWLRKNGAKLHSISV